MRHILVKATEAAEKAAAKKKAEDLLKQLKGGADFAEAENSVDDRLQAMHGDDAKGHGPAVSGVDPPAATQDEANDLLANLGI